MHLLDCRDFGSLGVFPKTAHQPARRQPKIALDCPNARQHGGRRPDQQRQLSFHVETEFFNIAGQRRYEFPFAVDQHTPELLD
jgi:hypothetical protein